MALIYQQYLDTGQYGETCYLYWLKYANIYSSANKVAVQFLAKYPAELVLCNYVLLCIYLSSHSQETAQPVAETNKAHTSSTFHTPISPPPPPAADPTFNELSITILSCSNLSTKAGS